MFKSIMKSKKFLLILFGGYTYIERILWNIVNIFPKFIRNFFYKLVFENFGKNVFIDEGCYFRYPWKISIGRDVVINRGCEFYPSIKDKSSKILLGQGVILAPNVVFFGAGQDSRDHLNSDIAKSIEVCNNAYVGGNSTIRYGVQIGESSIVAAGSVVVKSVRRNTIVGGNPATFIRDV
jgi:acetyltransferase-like isoleucine patch superfamily enzyme